MLVNTSNSHILNVLPVNAGILHVINTRISEDVSVKFSHTKLKRVSIQQIAAHWEFIVTDIVQLMNKGIKLSICLDNPLRYELPLVSCTDSCFNFNNEQTLSTPVEESTIEYMYSCKDKVFI